MGGAQMTDKPRGIHRHLQLVADHIQLFADLNEGFVPNKDEEALLRKIARLANTVAAPRPKRAPKQRELVEQTLPEDWAALDYLRSLQPEGDLCHGAAEWAKMKFAWRKSYMAFKQRFEQRYPGKNFAERFRELVKWALVDSEHSWRLSTAGEVVAKWRKLSEGHANWQKRGAGDPLAESQETRRLRAELDAALERRDDLRDECEARGIAAVTDARYQDAERAIKRLEEELR